MAYIKMNENEFGGTKLNKRPQPQQQQQQMQQQMMQQQQMQQQQMPQQQMQPQQRMPTPEEMYQMQQMQQMAQPAVVQAPRILKQKSNFAANIDSKTLKYSILVVLIFVLLNSKIMWKQIQRLPFMGTVDPSIIALIVNSILAGVIFYLICFVFKLI
jgi:hypothetical protein